MFYELHTIFFLKKSVVLPYYLIIKILTPSKNRKSKRPIKITTTKHKTKSDKAKLITWFFVGQLTFFIS